MADACGVEINLELSDGERKVAAAVTRSVERTIAGKEMEMEMEMEMDGSSIPFGNREA